VARPEDYRPDGLEDPEARGHQPAGACDDGGILGIGRYGGIPIVSYPILVQAFQVIGQMAEWETKGLGMFGQPFRLGGDAPGNDVVEVAEVLVEFGGSLYSIHSSCFNRSRGGVSLFKWCVRAWRMRVRKSSFWESR